MLTAGRIRTRQTTGEVCPHRCKTGENRAVAANPGGWSGDFASTEAVAAPCHLPVGLEPGYSGGNQGRMDRLSRKCRMK